jgi:hypothetical protein
MGRPWDFFANPGDLDHDADLERLARAARSSFEIIELWQTQNLYA